MSYCRFENTLNDLGDCYDHMNEKDDLSDSEKRARFKLIQMCKDIVEEYGDEDED